ncbi:MAG: hypothetical protein BAA04_00745 [Firmicutes bacterium ZCTH02-B6]|nr:MAG: hypothetical protein BAA04_00745 [Firmicutes bacterium ZCTH02-B6]
MTAHAAGRRGRSLLLASVAVVALWLGGAALWERVDLWLLRTALAEHRALEDSFTALAMIVRDEVLLTAPADGRAYVMVSDGSRVRAQAVVATILTDSGERVVQAPIAGNVHFFWDGWEQQVELDLLLHRAVRHWREVQPASGRIVDGQLVRAGDPIARIVDGHRVRLYLDLPDGVSLAPNQRVELRMPAVTDQTVGARVLALGGGEPVAALLELDRYLPVLDAARWVDAEVVRARHQGVVVPAAAIVSDGQRQGVYLRRETRVVFRTVRVVAQVHEWAVVEGISPGDQVVTNPGRVMGQ